MAIPGTLSLREAQLENELESIRKDGASDGTDPVQAAEQALDRLAEKAASRRSVGRPIKACHFVAVSEGRGDLATILNAEFEAKIEA